MENDCDRTGAERSVCIVLRAVPYGEADLILTLFSRTQGRINARAYGARSIRSAIRAACQPLCLAEFEFYLRRGRRSVKNADIISEFFNVQSHFEKYACACTALELTDKVLPEVTTSKESSELFTLLAVFMKALDRFEGDPLYVLLFFLLRAVNLLGIFPSLDTCVICGDSARGSGAWSWTGGGAVCSSCSKELEGEELDDDTRRCLARFGRGAPACQADLSFDGQTVRKAADAMQTMLRSQLGVTLRSARLLPM